MNFLKNFFAEGGADKPLDNLFAALAALISQNDGRAVEEVATLTNGHPQNMESWFALANVLKKYGYAREIEWKEEIADILSVVEELKKKIGAPLDIKLDIGFLDEGEDADDLETERALTLIGVWVVEHGYTLAHLDIDSDSYVLCLLPNNNYLQCENLLEGTYFSMPPF